MSDVFFREMQIPSADYNLGIGSASHGSQTGQMIAAIEKVLLGEKPDSNAARQILNVLISAHWQHTK